jgi:Na+/proline symporter
MANHLVFIALAFYILLLVLFTKFVNSKGDNNAFFRAGRKSPWLLVAFGMIGATISGVSLVSVPGWVKASGMTYFQMCLGFLAGYIVIAFLLLPLYYRLRLTTIYSYLDQRFGRRSHLTGASFFLLSKLTGAAARLYVTSIVLHEMAIRPLGLPFGFTVAVVLIAIFLYTRRGGIENIVRTDALQTFCLLAATVCIVWVVGAKLNLSLSGVAETIAQSPMGRMFCWDASSTQFFFRQFVNGMFITIVMNGLDQDMMQKNLTCTSLRNAQKNMCLYGLCILPVNLLFLVVGVLLYTFAGQEGLAVPDAGDRLLPMLVGSGALGSLVVFPFTIGITAAALSSADSAMTSLTTSICVDVLRVEREGFDPKRALFVRHRVHAAVALAFALCIAIFHVAGSGTIIDTIYRLAGYTYGPLLGLFGFGLFTRRRVIDRAVPYIAVASPSTLGFVAKITSFTFPPTNLAKSSFIFISSGPIPFIGEIEPCNT